MKILLVEDEIEMQKSIAHYLGLEKNIVEVANDFNSAYEKIQLYEYDCILLDITLPNGNGLDLIKIIKNSRPKTGIIIISAKNSFDDKIDGLNLGADDYLPKPFYLPELNARIKALIRRNNFDGVEVIIINEIALYPDERKVLIHTLPIPLTSKEFDLLVYFIANKNRVIQKNALVEHLWGDSADQFDNFDFIYNHVKNLRKKLLAANCNDYIQSIYGIGYTFKTEL
ncbi:DNA-binding response OmpR family regulator [Flavobacterium sp. CG_9.1]|uniref:response regulator transcription factor n=1 Tax=Flavobacterium sp. CG_9.1 TaxID=2787728 RepID=UPI0018CBAC6D|nr:response regulator transcription factor [Flavobacterium sp. CG_9.1]MBG6062298.1 DNA-binding response OmpR family regulator [Flavobacterium sp. CG_9.1]